jgi:chromosomal replication initiation ATPase DnaA
MSPTSSIVAMVEPRQYALDLGHAPSRARDDFVVTEANASALALVERWPDWPASSVALVGPAGSGKSHLAAIWATAAGARWVEATALDAAATTWRNREAVVVENIDAADIDEAGLFHLLNVVGERQGHLLLTARTPPATWSVVLPDLRSRLSALVVVQLNAPDDFLLKAVIAKQFADRQLAVEPDVVGYLVRRMERSLAEAGRIVEAIDQLSLAKGRRVTKALAAQVLDAPGARPQLG